MSGILFFIFASCEPLRGYCISYPKITMFVLYLKIINTFLENNICISYSKLSTELKIGFAILVDQAVFWVTGQNIQNVVVVVFFFFIYVGRTSWH